MQKMFSVNSCNLLTIMERDIKLFFAHVLRFWFYFVERVNYIEIHRYRKKS